MNAEVETGETWTPVEYLHKGKQSEIKVGNEDYADEEETVPGKC